MAEKQKKTSSLSQLQIAILVVFFLSFVGLRFWNARWPKETIVLANQEMRVIVAHTIDHRHKGLGGREDLGRYDGMLFQFPTDGLYTFVMRDTLFPIDIIWFDDGKVVDIAPNVQTELDKTEDELTRYSPRTKADTVLEVPAGWVDLHELRIGDTLELL